MKRGRLYVIVGFAGLMLAGCNRNPAQVSQQTLESNTTALEGATKSCDAAAEHGTPPSSDCQHVAFAAYEVRSQYAAGMATEGTAAQAVSSYYIKTGTLPVSNEQAGLSAPSTVPGEQGVGKYVGSVTVGPTPGVIAVKWSHAALAGKSMVLVPELPGNSHPFLCWHVDSKATTVPGTVRQLLPGITAGCH